MTFAMTSPPHSSTSRNRKFASPPLEAITGFLKLTITARPSKSEPARTALEPHQFTALTGSEITNAVPDLIDVPHYHVCEDFEAQVDRLVINSVLAYRQPLGFEGNLIAAADDLTELGIQAWPALSRYSRFDFPELEYFLTPLFRIEAVPLDVRMTALLSAACQPAANVRSRVLELADELPSCERQMLIRAVASSNFHDNVTERACERLNAVVS